MMMGDPKNVFWNPIYLHPKFILKFSVQFGCKSIGFPYTSLESTNIINDSYVVGFHRSDPLYPVEASRDAC